jgi:integrase/recombinase XerD
VVYDRKAKHKTVENYFSALSAFYDYLAFEGYVSSNIVLPFRRRYLNAIRAALMIRSVSFSAWRR